MLSHSFSSILFFFLLAPIWQQFSGMCWDWTCTFTYFCCLLRPSVLPFCWFPVVLSPCLWGHRFPPFTAFPTALTLKSKCILNWQYICSGVLEPVVYTVVFFRLINIPSLFRQSKVLCLMLAVFSLNLCVTTCRKWFLVHTGVALFFFPNRRETVCPHWSFQLM